MLDYIRRTRKSMISAVVAAFCVIMMAGFGIDFLNSNKRADHDVAATINSDKISFDALENRRAELEERLRRQFGANYASIRPLLQLEQQALDGLIDEHLLSQFLFKDLAMVVGTKQLEQEILKLPFFSKGFDPQTFRAYLQATGLTEQGFSQQLRYEIALQQLGDFVSHSQPFSRRELESLVREQETVYNFAAIEIDPKNFESAVTVDPTELQKYFDSKAESYRQPRAVKFAYVSFPFGEFASQAEVPDEEVQLLYERSQDNFRTPKELKLQQIYLQFPTRSEVEKMFTGKDQTQSDPREEKLIQASDIVQSARNGADFTDLVKRFSEDQETKAKGGNLGWKKLSELPQPLGNAARGLLSGEVSDPIQTDQGVYIIKAVDVKESSVKPLAEVKAQLLDELRKQDAPLYSAQAAEDFLSKWSTAEANGPQSLAEFAQTEKRQATVFKEFASAADLSVTLPAAIREKIMEYPAGSREVISAQDGSYVVEIQDVQEAQIPTLEQVKDRVVADYRNEQSNKLAEAEGQRLLDSTKTVAELMAAGTSKNFKTQNFSEVKRANIPDGALQSPEVQEAAFQLREDRPLVSKPLWFRKKLYLIGLFSRKYQEPADFDKLIAQRRTQEQQALRERFSKILVEYLRKRATIWENPRALGGADHA